jgi:hypothetical protein
MQSRAVVHQKSRCTEHEKQKPGRRESLPGLGIFSRRERRFAYYVVAMNAEEPQARRPDMGCAQQQQQVADMT